MYKVFIDGLEQAQADIINISKQNFASIEREDGAQNNEQILREKSTNATLSFRGATFRYVCKQIKADSCHIFKVEVYNDCGLEARGTFTLPVIEWNISKQTAQTPLKDTSFSAYLRDYTSVEIDFYYNKTRNCLKLPTVERNIVMPYNPLNQTDVYTIRAFDVLDSIRYLVNFITDFKINVVSNYLTNTKIALTTGYNMHRRTGANITQIYPTLSLNKIFTEVRKKTGIYMELVTDALGNGTLYIEQEPYFFDTETVLTIAELPNGLNQTFDISRTFNRINIGSENTSLEAGTPIHHTQNKLLGWSKETYINCGNCTAEKSAVLDLDSSFIIDSNVLFEALNAPVGDDYVHDDNIFMFEYYLNAGVATGKNTLLAPKYYYNDLFLNSNVLGAYIGYKNYCLALQRSGKSGFLLDAGVSGLALSDVAPTNENKMLFTSEAYDNLNAVTTGSHNFSGFVDNFNYFTVQENGIYNFGAGFANMIQRDQALGLVNVVYKVRIWIYTDNTFTTLLVPVFEEESAVIANAYATYVKLDLQTGNVPLTTGNTVLAELYAEMPTPNQNTGYVTGLFPDTQYFTLLSDNLSCETLSQQTDNKPIITKFDYLISWSQWLELKKNKRKAIDVAGFKLYLKEVNYRHKKKSSFTLIGNDIICTACVE